MDTGSLAALGEVISLETKIMQVHGNLVNLIAGIIWAGENPTMAVIDDLRTAAAALRTRQTELDTAISSAIMRLSDNPSPTDVAEVVADLKGLDTAQGASVNAINNIDPDVSTGGVVVDPNDPGGVVSSE